MKLRQQLDETKSNANLAVIRNRHQQHADNLNFLQNMVGMPHLLTVLIFEYVSFHVRDIVHHGLIYYTGYTGTPRDPGFFSVSHDRALLKYAQAEVIARNHILTAGPLTKLIEEASKNPMVLLRHISITINLAGIDFTLEGSPLQLAIILLDQRIISSDPAASMIDKSQSEVLMDLIKDLIPDSLVEAYEQACFAASFDPEEPSEKAKRLAVLTATLDLVKEDKFDAAHKIIMDYVNTKPEVITDNRFFAGLLQMVPDALDLLASQAGDLEEGLRGKHADQYCFLIGMLRRFLPFMLRKALETGAYNVLYGGMNINRTLDVCDRTYLAPDSGNRGGWLDFALLFASVNSAWVRGFQHFCQQLHQCSRTYAAIEHSTGEQRHDSAESPRSP